MKKSFTIFVFVLVAGSLLLSRQAIAQPPEKMSYQAVMRNSGNELVTNQEIGMRISILKSSIFGASVYVETQTPTTNANGLVCIEIGGEDATVISGTLSAIDWSDGPYFIKTETDPSGGTNYSITGTCQLLSVPYAMHSKSSEILTGEITEDQISDLKDYLTNETDPMFSEWDKSTGITITENQVMDLREYLTEETDPVFDSSPAAGVEANHITNWNVAHGWGDHSTQGYLKTFNETDPTWSGDANQSGNIGRGGNVGIGTTSPTQKLDVDGQVRIRGGSPAAGKVLTSDAGGVASWQSGSPPSGAAAGDLTGTYPNPSVARIRGRNISTAAPNSGQVLKWDGSNWTPQADGLSLPFSGSNSGPVAHGIYIGHTATSGTTYGGYFSNSSTSGTGVYGYASAGTGTNYGVYGKSNSTSGSGVYGEGFVQGVEGRATSATALGTMGGYFTSEKGYGVYGYATASTGYTYGVYGRTNSSSGYAGYFQGRVHVTGSLSKGGGSFEIDHPLDPTNKMLRHSFVESPDMMNVYNGNVRTDGFGSAIVMLPDYFETLNMDFRYQLTVIGEFAQAIISEKISGNRFKISTDKPNVEVSWQVTGVRKDPWAEKNRIIVEEYKDNEQKGYYLYPEVYGQPETMSVEWGQDPVMMRKMKEEVGKTNVEPPQPYDGLRKLELN